MSTEDFAAHIKVLSTHKSFVKSLYVIEPTQRNTKMKHGLGKSHLCFSDHNFSETFIINC